MTRAGGDTRDRPTGPRKVDDRAWIWALRGVGVLVVLVAGLNVLDLASHVLSTGAAAPGAPKTADDAAPPVAEAPLATGAYHIECAEFRSTMTARVRHVVGRLLPGRLVGSSGPTPSCSRCGDMIEDGSEIWVAGSR